MLPGVDHSNSQLIFFFIVCFTSYFVFSIAVLPHRPGVVYYHLLLRRETRIPGVAPFSFRIGIWDLFVHREQKSYTPTAFGKLWTTPGVRCTNMPNPNPLPRYENGPGIEPGTFGLADECSTTELTLLIDIDIENTVNLVGQVYIYRN